MYVRRMNLSLVGVVIDTVHGGRGETDEAGEVRMRDRGSGVLVLVYLRGVLNAAPVYSSNLKILGEARRAVSHFLTHIAYKTQISRKPSLTHHYA
jgi:hypothetical protein